VVLGTTLICIIPEFKEQYELWALNEKLKAAKLEVENAESSKIRLDAILELKKAAARLEALTYLN
jgi:hypothetical protein